MNKLVYKEQELCRDNLRKYHKRPTMQEFEFINPKSTGTTEKQKAILNIPGLTVAAFLEHNDVTKFFSPLKKMSDISCLNFKPSPSLHLTILGLSNGYLTNWYEDELRDLIENFFRERNTMRIRFEHIRPGSYIIESKKYKPNK